MSIDAANRPTQHLAYIDSLRGIAYGVVLTFVVPVLYLTRRYVETPGPNMGRRPIAHLSRYQGAAAGKI